MEKKQKQNFFTIIDAKKTSNYVSENSCYPLRINTIKIKWIKIVNMMEIRSLL